MLTVIITTLSIVLAQVDNRGSYIRWTNNHKRLNILEQHRHLSEIHQDIASSINIQGMSLNHLKLVRQLKTGQWGF